jgi:hypothetical protein
LAKDLNRNLSKEDKWSKGIQNENLNQNQMIALKMVITKKTKDNKCWRRCEGKGILAHC